MLNQIDRRRPRAATSSALKPQLNDEQMATLLQLERFGWTLKFIRSEQDGGRIAAVYDPDHDRFAALEPDGAVNTDPSIRFRQ